MMRGLKFTVQLGFSCALAARPGVDGLHWQHEGPVAYGPLCSWASGTQVATLSV